MTEPADQTARAAEARLDEIADTVRKEFDRITASRFGTLGDRTTDQEASRAGEDSGERGEPPW